ncbi:MAG: VOC family protein [Ilumatobacter sp.]
MSVSISFASYICDDIDALSTFYADVFGFTEVEELHSDIFRGLDADGTVLGFSAKVVYEMLSIERWSDATGTKQYLTFEVDSSDAVVAATTASTERGAELLHEPYETYYGAFQSVLADPEGNVFRINHMLE